MSAKSDVALVGICVKLTTFPEQLTGSLSSLPYQNTLIAGFIRGAMNDEHAYKHPGAPSQHPVHISGSMSILNTIPMA